MTALVTKDSLNAMLQSADLATRGRIIGRALVVLFNRQTAAEQASNTTDVNNNIGFAGSDAKTGTLSAKSFLKHGTLQPWVIEKWMAPSRGYPRICKYARQLNEAAQEKAIRLEGKRLAALRCAYGEVVDSDDPAIIEPIVKELRELEQRLGVEPYVIAGAVA